jgi:two-component system chemotaxis sensor kinase CheA
MPESTQIDTEILQEFLAESRENLNEMECDLLAWEKQAATREALDRIFRAVHTLKGTCGFLGYPRLETVAHQAENLLSQIRDRKIAASSAAVTVLLKVVDVVRRLLGQIEQLGSEGEGNEDALLTELAALQHTATAEPAPLTDVAGEEQATAGGTETTIRVDIALLDRLMNLVGELVLARNQLTRFTVGQNGSPLAGTSQRLSHITSELQQNVMKTRLQPIGNIWSKFPRLVRDGAMAEDKKIRLLMTGQQTETDKSIIEAIKDPLAHLVRNCVTHGIEKPEKRRAAGKPEEGVINIRSYHEGGQVVIEVSDDGAGIPTDLIREAAIRRRDVTPEQAAVMDDHELQQLIFLPGFSTAKEVTKLSGRGVGMDVVKINLDRIHGSIAVISRRGEGTLFKMKIPLTLTIIPALIVKSCGERFAIPQVSLVELVRLNHESKDTQVESLFGAPVYRLRGKLLPLIHLRQELGFPARPSSDHGHDGSTNIVVLQADGGSFGLVVDEVQDIEEIVVKPLSKHLKVVHQFSGATIMGDGHVALILDVLSIAQQLRLGAGKEVRPHATSSVKTSTATADTGEELLLFELGSKGRMAMKLSDVTRLEEFLATEVENEGAGEVIQYDGHVMPLVPLSRLLLPESQPGPAREAHEKLQVIVHNQNGSYYGFCVDQILDITRQPLSLQHRQARPGILGSAIIQRRVTEVVDVAGIVSMATRQRPAPSLVAGGMEG